MDLIDLNLSGGLIDGVSEGESDYAVGLTGGG